MALPEIAALFAHKCGEIDRKKIEKSVRRGQNSLISIPVCTVFRKDEKGGRMKIFIKENSVVQKREDIPKESRTEFD